METEDTGTGENCSAATYYQGASGAARRTDWVNGLPLFEGGRRPDIVANHGFQEPREPHAMELTVTLASS